MFKNAIIGQSGGPTAVINASLYGVIKEAMEQEQIHRVYGMKNGIEGLLKGNILDLKDVYETKNFDRLKHTPASFLGSCRFKLPEIWDETYQNIFQIFKEYEIGYFFYIGGNDSMDTVSKLSAYAKEIGFNIKIIGIPKTIDNDLYLTDHTPGYGSAAKFIATSVKEIMLDSKVYDMESVTIVEIMGRHTGWLTAASALALDTKDRCELMVYLPETPFDMEGFIESLKDRLKLNKTVIVAVSEGIKFADGTYVCETGQALSLDNFGHKSLGGCGKVLENEVKNKLTVKVRSIELNVLQRCASTCASKTDIDEAVMAGKNAVTYALQGETGKMVAFVREKESDYEIKTVSVDVENVCNKEKFFPATWIYDICNITDDFIAYVKPLIAGEVQVDYENGIPVFLEL